MATATPTPSSPKSKRISLFDFIEENQKLLTAIAAFIAMTAFLIQATTGDNDLSRALPRIPLFGALLLILELLLRIPAEGTQKSFRLLGFEMVILALGGSLAWLWYRNFPTAWAFVVLLLILALFFLALALVGALFYFSSCWLLKRRRKRSLTEREDQFVFLGSTILSVVLVATCMHSWTHHSKIAPPQASPPQSIAK